MKLPSKVTLNNCQYSKEKKKQQIKFVGHLKKLFPLTFTKRKIIETIFQTWKFSAVIRCS